MKIIGHWSYQFLLKNLWNDFIKKMNREIEIKWERIKKFLKENNLNGVLLNKVANFAWFTGGKSNFVSLHTEIGASSLLITNKKIYFISNNIEFPRMIKEEIGNFNFENISFPWYQDKMKAVVKKIAGDKVGSDKPDREFIPVSIENLHFPLLEEEIKRYKQLGKESSTIMTEICKNIRQGDKEIEIAGKLSKRLWELKIIPVVILIAGDERIKNFRHPLPTSKKIKKHVMVVLCAKRDGLIVSLTRIVHFGKIPKNLKNKHFAVCKVDACFINETIPGKKIGEVFGNALEIYKETGYKNEWKLHHQGGLTGYLTRYYKGYKNLNIIIEENQAFAWNPSITGTKSEDTIITTKIGSEIISEDKNWPMIEIKYKNKILLRPDILQM